MSTAHFHLSTVLQLMVFQDLSHERCRSEPQIRLAYLPNFNCSVLAYYPELLIYVILLKTTFFFFLAFFFRGFAKYLPTHYIYTKPCIHLTRSAEMPDARSHERLNFVHLAVIVDPWYGRVQLKRGGTR